MRDRTIETRQYDVALSFAGEDRRFVEAVAVELRAKGISFFYDCDAAVELWGRDLVEELDDIYRKRSRYVVLFISVHYVEKAWTRLERRSALARALTERHEYILPARFDDTELPGVQPTIAWIDLRNQTPESFATRIYDKLHAPRHAAAGRNTYPVLKKPIRRVALVAGMLLVLAAIGTFAWQRYRSAAAMQHNQRGLALISRGDADGAAREFTATLAIDRNNAAANSNLSLLASDAGDMSVALDHARIAVQTAPNVAIYQYNLGALLSLLRRDDEALEHLDRAIVLEPKYGQAYNEIGVIYLRLKRPADAETALTHGIRFDPDLIVLQKNLGVAELANGHARQAARQLSETLRRWSINDRLGRVELLRWLIEAQWRDGDLTDACSSMEQLSKLDPATTPWAADSRRLTQLLSCGGSR